MKPTELENGGRLLCVCGLITALSRYITWRARDKTYIYISGQKERLWGEHNGQRVSNTQRQAASAPLYRSDDKREAISDGLYFIETIESSSRDSMNPISNTQKNI